MGWKKAGGESQRLNRTALRLLATTFRGQLTATERKQLQQAMTALAAGQRSEFRPVFETLWPILRRFCTKALRDPVEAEDAAQAAMMKLLVHAGDFDAERDAVAWALGFASFECLSLRNRRNRRRETKQARMLLELPAAAPSPEEALVESELHGAILEAVGSLGAADAAAIAAALSEDRPQPATTGTTFRKRLQRARQRLRLIWRRSTHGTE